MWVWSFVVQNEIQFVELSLNLIGMKWTSEAKIWDNLLRKLMIPTNYIVDAVLTVFKYSFVVILTIFNERVFRFSKHVMLSNAIYELVIWFDAYKRCSVVLCFQRNQIEIDRSIA